MSTICLNMIVKNEGKIIKRLLESVKDIIDTYCICDTGSTDNTIEVIQDYFNTHNIKGKIVVEPFVNFAVSRNSSMKHCLGLSDYILLLDADMILKINNINEINNFKKNVMSTYDSCFILQGNDNFFYQNMRIVRNNGKYNYVGVTHEYINTPQDNRNYQFNKDVLFISDIGDGGSKSDKFERDIRLLLKGIEDEPKNERYYFYLANSYHDCGKFNEAIEMYKKRIDFGGWEQEVWYSYYRIGFCYKNTNRIADAMYYWLLGYNYYSDRIENLYEIIYYYRVIGKCKLAKIYYDIAKSILDKNLKRENYLFLHNDVYTYKLAYENTIISYHIGLKNINDDGVIVFNNSDDRNCVNNLLSNMKFYKDILQSKEVINFSSTTVRNLLCDNDNHNDNHNDHNFKMYSSSNSIIDKPDNFKTLSANDNCKYLMNVRYVNYKIDNNGRYLDCENHIVTTNKYVELDKDFNVLYEKWFDEEYNGRLYIGCEDVRIFNDNGFLKFMGTGFQYNDKLGILYGDYNINDTLLNYNEIRSPYNSDCEKNWVFFDNNDKTNVVYKWYPLEIHNIQKINNVYSLKLLKSINMPKIFSYTRGSTNGYLYDNQIWFVNHIVSYEQPRHYYHIISVFDKDMNLLRYTAPFKFTDTCIEYSLGLIVEDDRVLITYSTWDRTTNIGIYDKSYIESKLLYK